MVPNIRVIVEIFQSGPKRAIPENEMTFFSILSHFIDKTIDLKNKKINTSINNEMKCSLQPSL